MAYRTLIFDFDGTLADTLEESRRIYNSMAPEYGLRQVAPEELAALRHFTLKQLVKHLGIPSSRIPVIIARGTAMMRGSILKYHLIPGVAETLPTLRTRCQAFGILTSNAAANVDLFLRTHGLRKWFNFIATSSKLTGKAKHLRAIRRNFGLKHSEMLYIGDEIRDVRAAKKAEIPVLAVTWGFNSAESLAAAAPDHLIHSADQLLALDYRP